MNTPKAILIGFALVALLGSYASAQMRQDSAGRWVNPYGGNPYGDSRVNPQADPRVNPELDSRVNPRMDPRVNPELDPRVNPRVDPRFSPQGDPRFRKDK